MADNYLENKFEEYQARKNGKGKPRIIVKHEVVEVEKPKTMKLDRKLNVAIVGGNGDFGRKLVSAFAEDGHRLALLNDDSVLGRMTASKTNSIFLKCDINNSCELKENLNKLYDLWGRVDIVINLIENFYKDANGVISDILVSRSVAPFETSMRCVSEIVRDRHLETEETGIINVGWIYGEKMKDSEPFSSSVAVSLAKSSFQYRDLKNQNIIVNSIFVKGDKMPLVEDKNLEKSRVEANALKLISLLVNPENNFIQGETFSL